ncbi:MAG: ABC transporter permease [Clostridium sp.]|jgi:simple sugar transport system permease protein|nr:ABC transporter permease [Clostridium sp.]
MKLKKLKKQSGIAQLLIPIIALLALLLFNLIRDPSFFSLGFATNNLGDTVLAGNLVSIFNNASELAILAMGMTLVTAACGGQDISVGAAAAIAGSVFIKVLKSGEITAWMVLIAFLLACVVAVIFGLFNGVLVAIFKIQPMIATLILFTMGRSIAYWINGGATPTVTSPIIASIGGFIPGIPIPTPIFIVIGCALIIAQFLKFTNLGIYTQAVGINHHAARLNGINTVGVKLLTFAILGLCVAVTGCMGVSRMGLINHSTFLLEIEMDAILAVAIGGNALSGGKFRMIGSLLGAYAIQTLTTTLYAMEVPSTDVKAYKAIVIIIIVLIGSPVFKEWIAKINRRRKLRGMGAAQDVSAVSEGQ